MTTYLLIQTEPGRARDLISALQSHPDVVRVEHVGGAYDVVALVESPEQPSGNGSDAAATARLAPGVLRALECVILEEGARPAA